MHDARPLYTWGPIDAQMHPHTLKSKHYKMALKDSEVIMKGESKLKVGVKRVSTVTPIVPKQVPNATSPTHFDFVFGDHPHIYTIFSCGLLSSLRICGSFVWEVVMAM